jgi:hypothetical protein
MVVLRSRSDGFSGIWQVAGRAGGSFIFALLMMIGFQTPTKPCTLSRVLFSFSWSFV